MQKRLISMVLALSMALSAMPLPALAQSAPPDTASAAALAEENGDVTNIYTSNSSGKPIGDLGDSGDSWSYDEASNTLTLKTGTFRLYNYTYNSYNNYIKWNIKIEEGATLQESQIGPGYAVTNAGTISGGIFYSQVICKAGAVIGGGTFKKAVTVDAADVTIDGGTFEYTVYVKAVDALTIYGGTFKGGKGRSLEIGDATAKVTINGGSFETDAMDFSAAAAITINSGLFKDSLYDFAKNCTVNGGLFTAASDPLSPEATVNGGYFTAKRTGLVKIDASNVPVCLPVAVAADGAVNKWSADAYSTLYVTPNTSVTLKPTRKLDSIVSGDDKLSYKAESGVVSFTAGTEAVRLNSDFAGELVIEATGFPKGTNGGVYGAKGNGWSFDPNHKHAEWHTSYTPVLTIEEGTELNLDKVKNENNATVNFAIENNGTLTGTLNSTQYVYNKKTGTINDATLNSLENRFYNDGRVENSVLRFYYIGNGWRDPAQSVIILSSALDVSGSVANSSTYQAVLEDCYNSDDYTGNGSIRNGGTIKDGRSTLKLAVKNTAGYDGNAKYRQPTIDGGEYTFVYNKNGIYLNDPIIHVMAAKKEEDANVLPGATCYTMKYTPPENARFDAKYISGLNGTLTGIWSDNLTTLYVATIDDSISALTCDRITSVNGVAYNGSVRYDTERYTSTIDLHKYNIPQTHIINLSATGEGAAELPPADSADFTFTLPNNLIYDGNPKTVEVNVKDNATKKYGDITVTYKKDGKVLDGAPVEPGTYTFTAVVAATATCAGGDVTPKDNKFTISKAAPNPADFTVTDPDLTYDGKPKTVTVTNTSGKNYGDIIVSYQRKSDNDTFDGVPKEPGEYSYTVTVTGSALYVGGTVKTGSFRITKDDTPEPEPEKTYKLTVTGADVTLPEGADAGALKAGQPVSLTAYPDTATERFAQWLVSGADGAMTPADLMDAEGKPLTEDAFKQRTLTFRMPAQSLNISTVTTPAEQQPEESTEFSPLQTAAIVVGTTAWFAGGAVLGYEAVTYSILADLLPKGTAIPRTRAQLAALLWSTAGKPEPTAPAVYSDVAESDTAKAARWAVETGLLPDMDEGVFTPGKRVTKVQVIRAWNRLKKLGLAK